MLVSTVHLPVSRRRSPYGERGLKLQSYYGSTVKGQVALLTESVD